MNAITNTEVAVSRVGIISTPNQPTYNRLLVEVMNPASLAQSEVPPEDLIQIDAVIKTKLTGIAENGESVNERVTELG